MRYSAFSITLPTQMRAFILERMRSGSWGYMHDAVCAAFGTIHQGTTEEAEGPERLHFSGVGANRPDCRAAVPRYVGGWHHTAAHVCFGLSRGAPASATR